MNVLFVKQRKVGSCRVENTETKVEKHWLDYPALSCNAVSARTSTVVARERRLEQFEAYFKVQSATMFPNATWSSREGKAP